MPLPIPTKLWVNLSINFVLGLTRTKGAYVIPCHKIKDSTCIAYLFMEKVVNLYSIQHSIVSNRDVIFLSYF